MVVITLMMLFVSVVFLGGLYRSKLYALQEARALNMYNATNNCEPKGFSAGVSAASNLESPSLPAEVEGFGIDLAHTVLQGGGVSRTTTTQTFQFGAARPRDQAAAPLVAGHAGKVTGRSYTLCNEKRLGISLKELVLREFHLINDTFGTDFKSLIKDLF